MLPVEVEAALTSTVVSHGKAEGRDTQSFTLRADMIEPISTRLLTNPNPLSLVIG